MLVIAGLIRPPATSCQSLRARHSLCPLRGRAGPEHASLFFHLHPGAALCPGMQRKNIPKITNQTEKNMKTNTQENKQIETNQPVAAPTGKPYTGFNMSVMPVLSKTGEHILFYLPGDITITEHVNRFKGLLGLSYTPKAPTERSAERQDFTPRLGMHAKVRVGLSKDGQWVTLYLPGNMKVSNHVNAYKLNRPFRQSLLL